MYNNSVELGQLAIFIHSNWWLLFAIFGLINFFKFLWSYQGKKNEGVSSRAQTLAIALVMVKRKAEEHYEGEEVFVVYEEERQVLSDESRYPDKYSIMEEVKSWAKHQDALAKKRAVKAREEFRAASEKKSSKEFRPQFHQKNGQSRPQRSEKTTEIWLPGGQIKRV